LTNVDRSIKDFTPEKGKPSRSFNKWEWKLLKLPSEPDQAKTRIRRSRKIKKESEEAKCFSLNLDEATRKLNKT